MYIKEIIINGFKSFADKLTIELDPTFTGIVGPNGSGKSTLLNMLSSKLEKTSGDLVIGTTTIPCKNRTLDKKFLFIDDIILDIS
mgnify:CR=1 FL=1